MTAYLDNSATTPVCPAATAAAVRVMNECWGNPSSLHAIGDAALGELNAARRKIARLIGASPETLVFTSGGTEANNLALFGGVEAYTRSVGKHIVTTAIEHASILACCDRLEKLGYEVTRVAPDRDGNIPAGRIADACRNDTVMVSVMAVNHETGVQLPIREMIPTVRAAAPKALIHCDAVQAAGKTPVFAERWGVDLMSISAHKLHAPKGCGALYVKKGIRLMPQMLGGNQERGIRCGTETVPLIAAFGASAEQLPSFDEQDALYRRLNEHLRRGLAAISHVSVTFNSPANAAPFICNISVPDIKSAHAVNFLSGRGVYVSGGSACSGGKPSAVLTAMGLPAPDVESALRISFAHTTTECEIDEFVSALHLAAQELLVVKRA